MRSYENRYGILHSFHLQCCRFYLPLIVIFLQFLCPILLFDVNRSFEKWARFAIEKWQFRTMLSIENIVEKKIMK